MLHWLLTIRIDTVAFLVPLDVVAALMFLLLVFRPPLRSWFLRSLVIVVVGVGAGLLISWLVSDVWDVFGLPITGIMRMWVALACAGLFLAIANLWRSRWPRKLLAVISAVVFLVAAADGINVDAGAYRNLTDALGISPYKPLAVSLQSGRAGTMDPTLATTWTAPGGMPTHGTVGMVTIPATRSHFAARRAAVYLPPAALVRQPPVLPVLVVFPGQPGAPQDMFTSGRVASTLDHYAAQHNGLAPIVVAPDQLGSPGRNPMCVDSPLGNAATYLTVDVPNWIRGHLHVSDAPRYWGVGGYSEGGTCSIQFGAGHPELFGSFIDILGELKPTIGSDTVAKAFHGSHAAYDAITPKALLARHAPYADSYAIFGEGSRDTTYARYGRILRAAAEKAGMTTRMIVSPGSGHDWNTVRYVFARALPDIANHFGLGR